MDLKYGLEHNVAQTPLKLQSWRWRDLLNVCRERGRDGWFQEEVGWKLGRGGKARFWEDVWVGNVNLKSLFLRLFFLSLNQGQKVEEVGVWEESVWRWTLRWRRVRFEWEIPLETGLGIHISRATVTKDNKDDQVWRSDESGNFTVSSAYECLVKADRGPHIAAFKYLWKIKTFPNVMITSWRVLLGRVPTRECLSKKGVTLNTIVCALCQSKEESCQHLFLECKHALSVWALCYRWIGILFVQHNDLITHFESFHLIQSSNKQNLVWKGVWANIVRCMWEHKNSVVFNQGVVDVEEVFQNAQLKSWLWIKHKALNFNYSFAESNVVH